MFNWCIVEFHCFDLRSAGSGFQFEFQAHAPFVSKFLFKLRFDPFFIIKVLQTLTLDFIIRV